MVESEYLKKTKQEIEAHLSSKIISYEDLSTFIREVSKLRRLFYRVYFGVKFYKSTDGYWVSTSRKYPHAHRWVWINHYGEIPKGLDVHHKDEDKSNNEIENLELLSRSSHLKKHWEDEQLRKERAIQLEKVRPQAIKWLRSPEGRKHQSDVSKKAWKKRKTITKSCLDCGKEFDTTQSWAKCCHTNCYARWKRKQRSRVLK